MLAQAETETGVRIDDASKSDLCSAHARDLTQGMVHVWQLPEAVGACVVGWRSLGEFTAVSAESAAVYFGHMFAAELLHPQFSAPGALDAAAQAAGLDASTLGCLRAGRARIRALVDALQ